MRAGRSAAQYEDMFAGARPVVVSDSPRVSCWAADLGLSFVSMTAAVAAPPPEALIICVSDQWYREISLLQDAFSGSRALWLPLAAFDGSPDAVGYNLAQLARSDFGSMPGRHRAAIALVQSSSELSFWDHRGTDVIVRFADSVQIATILDTSVPVGDFTPLLGYFEVEAEFPGPGVSPVTVNGTLRPAGILAARGPRGFTSSDPEVREAHDLLRSAAASGKAPMIEIAGGMITGAEIAGEDVTRSFERLAGKELGLKLTEFSFGVNDLPPDTIQWDVNSPLNEGVRGIHFGIGDGHSGLHIDFVCPMASLTGTDHRD